MKKEIIFLFAFLAAICIEKASSRHYGAIIYYDSPGEFYDFPDAAGIAPDRDAAAGRNGGERGQARFISILLLLFLVFLYSGVLPLCWRTDGCVPDKTTNGN